MTPTRVVLHSPQTELSNRVLRHYKQHSDRFVRVSFVEEDSGQLHLGNAEVTSDLADRSPHLPSPSLLILSIFVFLFSRCGGAL